MSTDAEAKPAAPTSAPPGRPARPIRTRERLWLVAGVLVVVTLGYVSLGVGAADLGVGDLLSPTSAQWDLLLVSRLPRLAAVLLSGAALSVAGLIMQRLTQNRFVSPSTSGVVEAAVLGVVVATVFLGRPGLITTMVAGIVTAVVASVVFIQLINRMQFRDPIIVALVGMMYGGVIGALTMFIAYQADLVQFVDIWTTGSFSGVIAGRYEPLFLVVVVGIVGYLFAGRFTVVGMGRQMAVNLGVNYRSTLYLGLVVASVMAAVVVVVVGVIPFLGLIIPNLVSLVMGDHVHRVLPVTALAGAGFVLACDVVGRVVNHPYELPVATVAGAIGGVVFVWLVLTTARGRTA